MNNPPALERDENPMTLKHSHRRRRTDLTAYNDGSTLDYARASLNMRERAADEGNARDSFHRVFRKSTDASATFGDWAAQSAQAFLRRQIDADHVACDAENPAYSSLYRSSFAPSAHDTRPLLFTTTATSPQHLATRHSFRRHTSDVTVCEDDSRSPNNLHKRSPASHPSLAPHLLPKPMETWCADGRGWVATGCRSPSRSLSRGTSRGPSFPGAESPCSPW